MQKQIAQTRTADPFSPALALWQAAGLVQPARQEWIPCDRQPNPTQTTAPHLSATRWAETVRLRRSCCQVNRPYPSGEEIAPTQIQHRSFSPRMTRRQKRCCARWFNGRSGSGMTGTRPPEPAHLGTAGGAGNSPSSSTDHHYVDALLRVSAVARMRALEVTVCITGDVPVVSPIDGNRLLSNLVSLIIRDHLGVVF